jgi:hypothetical protein
MWLPRVMQYTSHLKAMSFQALRSIPSSIFIAASRIISVPSRIVAEETINFVLDIAPEMKIKRREVW